MTAEVGPSRFAVTREREISFEKSLASMVGTMRISGVTYHDAIRQFQAAYVSNVIIMNHGHLGKVAVQLGMHRNTLTRTLRELDLKKRMQRP